MPFFPPYVIAALLVSLLSLVVGTGVILWYMYRLYQRRQDVRYFPWVFAVVGLYVFAPVPIDVAIIISFFRPIMEMEISLVFVRGLMTLATAFFVILVYPKLVSIPSRQEIEEAYALFQLRDTIALEGRISSENGHMISANPAAVELYGFDNEQELINVPVRDLIHPEDYELVMAKMQMPITEKYYCRGMTKKREVLYLCVRGRTIQKPGQPPRRISSVQDLTNEVKAIESQKKIASKLKEEIKEALIALNTREVEQLTEEKKAALLAMIQDAGKNY